MINPASGIANDYLNTFNEVLLLIENMPVLLPEMVEDLERWKPVTYREYFSKSPLPGSAKALVVYEALAPEFRDEFERKIAIVTEIANEGRTAVLDMKHSSGEIEPDAISGPCVEMAAKLRVALSAATDLVNNGMTEPVHRAQALADRLMKARA